MLPCAHPDRWVLLEMTQSSRLRGKKLWIVAAAFILLTCALPSKAVVLLDSDDQPPIPASQSSTGTSSRYFFNLLDSRSAYGADFFPDLFVGPEFDRETQLEIDYAHAESDGGQGNEIDAEFDWNPVGQLTLAGEFGWESDHASSADEDDDDGTEAGFESVDLAAYHPIFQYVSSNRFFDYTAVVRLDMAIPTRTTVSGNDLQLTPWLGQMIRLGDHLSVQAWTGALFTIAPDQTPQFIYGAAIGYQIPHKDLPIPMIDSVTPMLELDGQRPFTTPAEDALFGVGGFHLTPTPVDDVQPSFGLGYQFPIDHGAGAQLRWGVILQFFLDF
jgi:hypothetical protein